MLRMLGLAVNRIGDAGANVLAAALVARAKAEVASGTASLGAISLNLRSNFIGDDGAAAFADAAAAGAPLVAVEMGYNRISGAGIVALAHALSVRARLAPGGPA